MIEVATAEATSGALLMFRMREQAIAKHVGIFTDTGTLIHARERLGVIEEPFTRSWRRRLAFAFLYPQPRRR
jgi:cell wall-associated NlpC family hydrolase